MLGYGIANLGNGAFYAFNNAALPLWLQGFTHNAILLGFMAGTHSFEGAIIQPIVGAASDHLRTRFGRRRPFMLICTPLSALLLVLTPLCAHLPHPLRLAIIVLCIFLSTVAFNIAVDPYQALLADITTPAQRGRATGVWFFLGALGQVAVLLLRLSLTLKFAVIGLLMIVTTAFTCATTREPSLPTHVAGSVQGHRSLLDGLRSLATLRQARTYLLMFFFYGAGVDAVLPNLTLFIQHITRCTNGQAQQMFTVLMASVAVGTVPMGLLSDRIGFKRLLLISFVLIGAAAALGLRVDTLSQVAIVLALAGLGVAAQNASAFPLLTRLVPPQEIGLFTGLQTTAVSISGPLALWLTGILVNHGGYRAIFGVCAVCIVVALLTLTRLIPANAPDEIEARVRQQT
jgi:maltose/moltooligosaccharide transporter